MEKIKNYEPEAVYLSDIKEICLMIIKSDSSVKIISGKIYDNGISLPDDSSLNEYDEKIRHKHFTNILLTKANKKHHYTIKLSPS
jgi:hypothetical protein